MSESIEKYRSDAELKKQKDEQYDNIIKRYNLIEPSDCMFNFDQVCEVIKMLEVKLFSAEESLKLSQELNAKYEKTMKDMRL